MGATSAGIGGYIITEEQCPNRFTATRRSPEGCNRAARRSDGMNKTVESVPWLLKFWC